MTAPSATRTCTSLTIVLIKPSKYDDEGYVIRYRRGFLPSNTLACLAALTEDVQRRGELGGDLRWNIRLFDDTVQEIPVRSIVRASRRKGNKTVVCLAGVQTNQFPRAADLALEFRRHGLDLLIGGFHVSGSMAMLPRTPPEIQQLLEAGVTVVLGEVEDRWGDIVADIVSGGRKPVYDFIRDPPALARQPLPVLDRRYLRHFMTSNFGTIDASRGCPFHCSFCTIINVQGRRMRCRDAATQVDAGRPAGPVPGARGVRRDGTLERSVRNRTEARRTGSPDDRGDPSDEFPDRHQRSRTDVERLPFDAGGRSDRD